MALDLYMDQKLNICKDPPNHLEVLKLRFFG